MKYLDASTAQVSAINAGATVLLLPMKPQPEMATPFSKIHRVDDGELLHERWPLQDRSFNNFGRCERLKAKPPFLPVQRVGVRERCWVTHPELIDGLTDEQKREYVYALVGRLHDIRGRHSRKLLSVPIETNANLGYPHLAGTLILPPGTGKGCENETQASRGLIPWNPHWERQSIPSTRHSTPGMG